MMIIISTGSSSQVKIIDLFCFVLCCCCWLEIFDIFDWRSSSLLFTIIRLTLSSVFFALCVCVMYTHSIFFISFFSYYKSISFLHYKCENIAKNIHLIKWSTIFLFVCCWNSTNKWFVIVVFHHHFFCSP